MVLYFSGTGNSQYVAFQISEMTADDEVVSINSYLKSGEFAAIHVKRPLVFVAPIYCWRMPKVVERWITKTPFKGNQDAYFILTCGGGCGNAAVYAEKLCVKKGMRFRSLAPVVMPENYLALFPTPSESDCRAIVENARPRMATLAKQIQYGKPFAESPVSLSEKLKSGPVNPLFYAFCVHDRGFSVSDRCISCGKCTLRYPLNNISLTNGRPVWRGNCTHCMACIGGCPTMAIEYKSKTKGRRRHYIMKDALCL